MQPNPLVQIALTFLMYAILAVVRAIYKVHKKTR